MLKRSKHWLLGLMALGADLAIAQPMTVDATMYWVSAVPFTSTFFDPSQSLQLADILERTDEMIPSTGNRHVMPKGPGNGWIALDLHNPQDTAKDILIINAIYLCRDVRFFLPDGRGGYVEHHRTYDKPFYGGDIPSRFPSVAWSIPPGTHRIYLKQNSMALNRVNVRISDPHSFIAKENEALVSHVFLLGIAFCLILIKFIQFLGQPNKASIHYCISTGYICFTVFMLSNFWRHIWLPYYPTIRFAELYFALSIPLGAIAPMEFAIAYLRLNELHRTLVQGLRILMYCLSVPLAILVFQDTNSYVHEAGFLLIFGFFVGFGLSLWKSKHSIEARYMAAGWGMMLLGLSVSFLGAINFTRQGYFNQLAISLAVPLENAFFFFGLSKIANDAARRRKEEIQRLNFLLKDRVITLKNIAAGVAHEINNPLAIVKGNLEIVKNLGLKHQIPDQLTARIDKSIDSVTKAAVITDELLVFAQDKGHHGKSYVVLEHVLRQVISSCRSRLWESGIKINTSAWRHQETVVLARPLQLTEAFLKVVNNSLDALADQNDPKISIDVTIVEPGKAQILISDNGPGVEDSIRGTMFEPFVTSKLAIAAPGLGLSSARSIIENHDGTIEEKQGYGKKIQNKAPPS